jgi:hypothetical protein
LEELWRGWGDRFCANWNCEETASEGLWSFDLVYFKMSTSVLTIHVKTKEYVQILLGVTLAHAKLDG